MDDKKTFVVIVAILLLFVGFVSLYQNGTLTGKSVEDMNTGTINLNYNESSKLLSVWGEAPSDTVSGSDESQDRAYIAQIFVTNASGYIVYNKNMTVFDNTPNDQTYNFTNINASLWTPVQYNIIVKFYGCDWQTGGSPHCHSPPPYDYISGYDVGMVFSGLVSGGSVSVDLTAVWGNISLLNTSINNLNGNFTLLDADLTGLETRMTNAENNITALKANDSATWQEIYRINSNITLINSNITAINLKIGALNSSINSINTTLNALQANVSTLQGNVTLLLANISALQTSIGVLQSNISTISSRLSLAESNITNINSRLFGTVNAAFPFTSANCTANGLPSGCTLEQFCSRASESFDFILAMNSSKLQNFAYTLGVDDVSFLNLVWDGCKEWKIDRIKQGLETLNETVYGDAKDQYLSNVRSAWCNWRYSKDDHNDPLYNRYCTSPSKTNNWLSDMTDLGIDDQLSIFRIELYNDDADKWEEIDDLWDGVFDLWHDLHYLEDRVAHIEDKLFGHDEDQFVAEARQGWCAWRSSKGDHSFPYESFCTGHNPEHNWEDAVDSMGYDDMIFTTARNLYYDSGEQWEEIDDLWNAMGGVWDDLDTLFDATYYGLHDIVFTSRVETYYNPNVTVPITYTLRTDQSSWIWPAGVWIKDPSKGFYRLLRTTYVQADTEYRFTDEVTFDELGLYDLKLEVRRGVFLPFVFESTTFTTDVVDLADGVPDSTVELKFPNNWGNNISMPPNPPNDDISWHKSGLINMRALIGANTPPADEACDVYYYSNKNPTIGRLFLSGLALSEAPVPDGDGYGYPIEDGSGAPKICADDILSTMMDGGEEGVYDIEVEQEFVGSLKRKDMMRIGIDDTEPVISKIVPSEGAYSGVLTVSVTATDPLSDAGTASGIDSVWVTLVNKNTSETYSAEAFLIGNDTWNVDFDTKALNISYGEFNITANVTDVAGNSDVDSVDPMIDNTAPEISDIRVPEEMCIEKESTISFYLTDLISGIYSKSASLTLSNGTIVDLTLSCRSSGYCTARYAPQSMNESPVNLTVNAEDYARVVPNSMTNVTTHNVTISVCRTGGGGSGGGAGGSGSAIACRSADWICSVWSDCSGSTQTRSCTKRNPGCYDGYEPELSRSCTMPSSGGAEVQQPTEIVPQPEVTAPQPETQAPQPTQTIWDRFKGSAAFWLILVGLAVILLALFEMLNKGAKPSGDVDKILAKYKKGAKGGRKK